MNFYLKHASQLHKSRLEDDRNNKTIELLGKNIRKLLCFEETERRSDDVKRLREKLVRLRADSKERVFLLRRRSDRFRNFIESTLNRYDENISGQLSEMRADLFKFRRSNLKRIREKFEESRTERKRIVESLETELLALDERIVESKDSENIAAFTLRLERESNTKIRVQKLSVESNQFERTRKAAIGSVRSSLKHTWSHRVRFETTRQ